MTAVNSFAEYYEKTQNMLLKAKSDKQLFEAIVNAPFHNKYFSTTIDLGMMVFVLVNKKDQTIDRITYSKTPPAMDAVRASTLEFSKIKIPLNDKENIIAKAIKSGKYQKTSDWRYILSPAITPDSARFNQAESGMGCSIVYPILEARDGAALIFSFYQSLDMIRGEHHAFMKNYTEFVASQLSQAN